MNVTHAANPAWLRSVRHFLGFDPSEAVAEGVRRGWIVPASAPQAVTQSPAPAIPAPEASVHQVSPIESAVRAAVAELGTQTDSNEFVSEEVRFHPAVLELRPSAASVRTYLNRMILEGSVAVVTQRSGPRPAVYRTV